MDVFQGLDEAQKKAVSHLKGGLLVMAPVGTGKTTVITRRAAYAIQSGLPPRNILCLSFTNRAAEEMRERVSAFLGADAREMRVSTFHSLCAHILRCDSDLLGIQADFSVYDEEDAKLLLHEVWNSLGLKVGRADYERFNSLLFHFVQDAKLAPYSGIRAGPGDIFRRLLAGAHLTVTDRRQDFKPEKILQLYQEKLADNHAFDFADLIAQVGRLFRENAGALSRWQDRYAWIQVDEVQDTNRAEYFIIASLAQKHKNLAFFGDVDQTIYEWRGSVPHEIIRDFRARFSPVTEVRLEWNYRSTRQILQACASVISRCPQAVTGDIYSRAAEDGEKVVIYPAATPAEEAGWIARKVRELRRTHGLRYSDIAVLTRTNQRCAAISTVLETQGLPHFLVDQYHFFRRAEIKDAMAYLRFLLNRYDANSLRRILARPPKGIGPATVRKIEALPRQVGLRLVDLADWRTLEHGDPFGLLLQELEEGRVVVFDVETTGPDVAEDEIVEAAAVRVGPGGITLRFHRYLKPTRPVGASQSVHGLDDDFLHREGWPPREALEALIEFMNGCVLVGHNISFDLGILSSNLARLGLRLPGQAEAYDTLEMARRFLSLHQYTLGAVCEALGVKTGRAHRAADDTEATFEVLKALLPAVHENGARRRDLVRDLGPLFRPLAEALKRWRHLALEMRPAQLLGQVLSESGLTEYWRKQEDGSRRVRYLEELLALFDRLDDRGLAPRESLLRILNVAALSSDADRYLLTDDKVPVLTVHQAKGLEFDTVFIAGATDSCFPSWLSQREGRIGEEHRLFYVAMTRARKRLILSYYCQNETGKREEISRFARLIPRHVVEVATERRGVV